MIVLELAVIALGAVVMAVGVHVAVRGSETTSRRRARAVRPGASTPAELVALELLVGGVSRAADVHQRLRPVLRDLAAVRLRRRGVVLDLDADGARELLGDELWEIVRPWRPLPADRQGPGLSSIELGRLLERLETL